MCGKTARTVRREGRTVSFPTPILFSKPIRAHEFEWLALDSKRQDEVAFRPSLFMETMDAKFE